MEFEVLGTVSFSQYFAMADGFLDFFLALVLFFAFLNSCLQLEYSSNWFTGKYQETSINDGY